MKGDQRVLYLDFYLKFREVLLCWNPSTAKSRSDGHFSGVTNTRKARTRKSPVAGALNLFLKILVLVLAAAQEAAYQNPSLETTRRGSDLDFLSVNTTINSAEILRMGIVRRVRKEQKSQPLCDRQLELKVAVAFVLFLLACS